MITVNAYKGKKVGVFGLGKAGEATVAALLAGGANVYAWDDSEKVASGKWQEESKFSGHWSLVTCPYSEWPWKEIRALALSPGVPLTHPAPHEVVKLANKAGCPVIGDIELLYMTCPQARYIGITGTNGKSTTTTLVGHILKAAGLKVEVGGNLGTAALSLEPLGEDGIYVLELSSYQLDLLKTARFDVAALLNITPDHLDRHGSMEGYVASKKHIFDRQRTDDTAVIAIDDDYTAALAEELVGRDKQKVIEVSAQTQVIGGVYADHGFLHDTMQTDVPRFDLGSIVPLTGRHNWQNAAVAYGVACAVGVAPDVIYKAMQSFGGLRHRLQLVETIRGVRFINDSKATNADAAANALAPYDTIYWIAGGKPKAGGIKPLEPYFYKIVRAFLIGEAAREFAETLEGKVPYTHCGTLKEAVAQAAEKAFADGRKDAVVLLSPACASFDQWKNFEERGDAFCAMVKMLAQGKAA